MMRCDSQPCARRFTHPRKSHRRDRTTNLQMSFWKMPFEMSGGFRLIPKHLGTRDFSRTSCQNTDIHLPLDWPTVPAIRCS